MTKSSLVLATAFSPQKGVRDSSPGLLPQATRQAAEMAAAPVPLAASLNPVVPTSEGGAFKYSVPVSSSLLILKPMEWLTAALLL